MVVVAPGPALGFAPAVEEATALGSASGSTPLPVQSPSPSQSPSKRSKGHRSRKGGKGGKGDKGERGERGDKGERGVVAAGDCEAAEAAESPSVPDRLGVLLMSRGPEVVSMEVASKISNAFGTGLVTLIVDHFSSMSQLTSFYRTFRLGGAYTLLAERMTHETRRSLAKALTASHRAILPVLNAWTNLALILERPGRCDMGLLERRSGAVLAECIRFAKSHISVVRGVMGCEPFVKLSQQVDQLPSIAFALARLGSTLTLIVAMIVRMLSFVFEYHRTANAFPTPVAVCAENPLPTMQKLEYPDASLLETAILPKNTTATSLMRSTHNSSHVEKLRASFTELICEKRHNPKLSHITKDQCTSLIRATIRQISVVLHDKLAERADHDDPAAKIALKPIRYMFVTDYDEWMRGEAQRYVTKSGSDLEGFMTTLLGIKEI